MLQYLKPKNTGFKKIRLGPNEDGGYVMPEFILKNCSALFTYGVGDLIEYELDFLDKYKKPVYTFDHTINWSPPTELNFTKEGLGFSENCNDFIVHYNQRNISGEVFLKVDIEGAEYPYFNSVDHDKLSNIVIGICLEVHWLERENYRQDFVNIMQKLEKNFTLTHIHPNNNGDYFSYNNENVCGVLELSLINNKYIKNLEDKSEKYPIEGLDFPNNPQRPNPILNIFN